MRKENKNLTSVRTPEGIDMNDDFGFLRLKISKLIL